MTLAENTWLATAETVAGDVLDRHAADVDADGRWPAESVAALAASGLLGLCVPAEFGGGAASPTAFTAVVTALARRCASTGMIYLMHACGTQVVAQAKSFPPREAVLREIAAGRHLTTLAFSEKGSRSHFWAPVSRAVADGEYHRLSAEKSWVTSAHHADSYVVSAGSRAAAGPTDSTLYYLPKGTPGLDFSARFDGMGLRGNDSAPVRLENVAVPDAHRLSDDGGGFGVMMATVLPWFQVGNAAVSVGIARAATEGIRRHLLASKLEHLGQPLAALMNLRARLAQMAVAADTAAAFLADVCRRMEAGAADAMLGVLGAKAAAGEMALTVTDLAMRTGGGACFSRHLSVERNFRDARAAAVMAPTTDALYDFIAKAMLDMPLF